MNRSITRRDFLHQTSLLTAKSPNEKVTVGFIGCNGRGQAHIAGYLAQPNAEIAYICDVDSRALAKGIAAVEKKQQRKPQGVKDLRRILDRSEEHTSELQSRF